MSRVSPWVWSATSCASASAVCFWPSFHNSSANSSRITNGSSPWAMTLAVLSTGKAGRSILSAGAWACGSCDGYLCGVSSKSRFNSGGKCRLFWAASSSNSLYPEPACVWSAASSSWAWFALSARRRPSRINEKLTTNAASKAAPAISSNTCCWAHAMPCW